VIVFWTLKGIFSPGNGGFGMKLAEWPGPCAGDWMKHMATGERANRKLLTGSLVQYN